MLNGDYAAEANIINKPKKAPKGVQGEQMNQLTRLKKKLAKLETEFEANPKAKIRNARILKKAEKIQKEIDTIEKH